MSEPTTQATGTTVATQAAWVPSGDKPDPKPNQAVRFECLRLAIDGADWITDGASVDNTVDGVIAIARKFEAYVTGSNGA